MTVLVVENLVPCYFPWPLLEVSLIFLIFPSLIFPIFKRIPSHPFPMKNKGIWSYSPKVKYPYVNAMKSTQGQFLPFWGLIASSHEIFLLRKEQILPFCVLESLSQGIFSAISPRARRCAEAPLFCTQTLLPSLFPPKNYFLLGLKLNTEPSSHFPWQLNGRCPSRVNSSPGMVQAQYLDGRLYLYFGICTASKEMSRI